MITHFFIDARIGPSCNTTCDFVIQFKIQNALVKCFNDATEVSSEKFKMANNTEELTKVTCELISDMSKCHDIDKIPLHLCYSSNEIQNKKDILLEQYISESNETESEVNINDCEDIKDYVDSGRADRMKKTSKLP